MKNDWEKKSTCSAYLSSKIFATSAWVWTHHTSFSSFQRPTDFLHISCICSIWKILHFYSSFSLNPSKSAFFHALTLSLPTCCLLFLNSAHAQDGSHRSGFIWILVILDNNSDNDSFGSFLSKKKNTNRILCSITV